MMQEHELVFPHGIPPLNPYIGFPCDIFFIIHILKVDAPTEEKEVAINMGWFWTFEMLTKILYNYIEGPIVGGKDNVDKLLYSHVKQDQLLN